MAYTGRKLVFSKGYELEHNVSKTVMYLLPWFIKFRIPIRLLGF